MSSQQVVALLVALAVVVALAKVLGALATRLAQPAVVGEILAGVLVGPTLFGGALANVLFPGDIRPMLSSLANVGLVFFMFLVGLEFNRDLLRERFGSIAVVSLGSMLTPFALGVLLATVLRPDDGRLAFVLYLGTAMAVTAFPVLARMISDWGMGGSKVGTLALGSAALGDLLAWSLLAVAIATLGAGSTEQWRLLLVLPVAAVSFWVVRPLLARIAQSRRDMFAVVLIGLLGWSALTEWMGLHFIFGAFLFGLVMPHGDAADLRAGVTLRIEQVSKVLLLPVYFVVAGLQVDLSRTTWTGFAEFGLIMLVAVGGKFAGALLAARLCRLDWRESATLGTLLNTRGLTELVILSIGLQLGLLDRDLYSQLVLMAVVTTMMTGPLVKLLHRKHAVEPVTLPVSSPRPR
ncbi:Kef-type K+ transport system membrane component KefB [Saccharothrix tamanrassetensis]|uniref:Kef-type K+ transport system membrane component KefB n=1 Tax=Saccharothrix tamanrassetensis TaxID=1051531 RepID=A0A841CQM8_9PSEU|nr:cation:proton antiporter [Saccharothrix tamanrassetensis]MBB5959520.1 Kef-type K+ transport system membrane component KefB [Saccharothrix tamanrassetensis]